MFKGSTFPKCFQKKNNLTVMSVSSDPHKLCTRAKEKGENEKRKKEGKKETKKETKKEREREKEKARALFTFCSSNFEMFTI